MTDLSSKIDPNGLYTVEQCARYLMEVCPELTFEQAYQEICDSIDTGKLEIAGYMTKKDPGL